MLIVEEDDDGVRPLVEELLLDRGYNVITAHTGAEGLDASGAARACLLSSPISECQGSMDGNWRAARPRCAPTSRFFNITGYPGEQRPDDAPPGPLLRKPWRAGEFYQCLEQLIGSNNVRRLHPRP